MNFLRFSAILTTCLLFKVPYIECTICKFGDYDFGLLKSSDWEVRWSDGTNNYKYKLNICDSLEDTQCGAGSSVCRYTNSAQPQNIGSYVEALNITEDRGEMWLHLTGGHCAQKQGVNSRAVINFKCGRSLGSPVLVDVNDCETFFEWSTHLACKRTFTGKEVKCYVYDKDGHKRDLSPLIKQSGNYSVESQNQRRFYINVCRELPRDKGCASEAAACVQYSDHAEDYGKPSGALSVNDNNELVLTYTTDEKPTECANNPKTTVTFKCPQRGLAHGPLLISDLDCHYRVEWRTEYACPEHIIHEENSCKLTKEKHQVEIDLTPLKRSRLGHQVVWNVTGKEGMDTYNYVLNVCNDAPDDGVLCPDADKSENVSSCQRKDSDAEFGKIIGKMNKQKLRYSDRNLTLIYEGGEVCSDNFHRTTVINFLCNKNAGGLDGEGWPIYNTEEGCTYIFDWETKYACLEHPLSATCSVQNGMKTFDLSPLVKTSGGNWEAESGHGTSDERYFLNLCHGVINSMETNGCPEDAAACRVRDGHAYSMGKFTESPVYQSDGSIKLHYTNGERNSETIITFKCKPGDLESAPVLVRKASDLSTYEFEWLTAAACVEATKSGDDCSVFDDELGLDFDLSQLTKPVKGGSAFYPVEHEEYMYYINVCEKVTGTPCEGDVGVCQGKPSDDSFKRNAGKPNSHLTYYDGMVNLTYTDGDKYSNGKLRKTQITFLCDRQAGHGGPEYVDEHDNTYFFKWMTSIVCPEAMVECLVYDHDQNKQYDLTSLSKGQDEGNWNALNDNNGPVKQKFYINMCRTLNPVVVGFESCDLEAAACMTEFDNNQEVIKKYNIGRPSGDPVIENDGILVEYKNGSPCGTQNRNYTTKIHLRCRSGALSTSPSYLSTLDECEYAFEWFTEAACPLNSKLPTPPPSTGDNSPTAEDCMLEDQNSEYKFNLVPLRKKNGEFYNVSGETFKINICGGVTSCPNTGGDTSAVCEGNTPLGRVNNQLSFSAGGFLTLKYSGTQREETVLTFKCNRRMADNEVAKIVFAGKDGDSYLFDVETPLACKPDAVDCVVTDSTGKEYDLAPLAKTTGNWNVMETAAGRTHLQYFINVCRPINIGTGTEKDCPGGPIGGCQVITDESKSFNTGYVQSEPIARSDGSLSIRYLGGTICHKGKEYESHRSTRINFYCSDIEGDPVFQGETAECEYVFEWRTPHACAQKKIVGENCFVTEPLYNYQFNMNMLRKETSDYSVKVTSGSDHYTYLLNVCGPLAFGNCQTPEAGACQTKPADTDFEPVNAGKANSALTYEDGLLSLTYTGGRRGCGDNERKTIINFRCDYSTYGTVGPKFVKEDSQCVYIFDWATHWACTPFKAVDCGITDPETGKQYELSPLTLTADNYAIRSQGSTNSNLYIINVCTTLVHKQGQTCPLDAAACRKNDRNTYESIGKIPERGEEALLSFDEKRNVILTYDDGGKNCTKDGTTWKTEIIFNCDKMAIGSQPQFLYEDESVCKTLLTWETAAACPINEQADVESDCTVKNAVTGYEFDIKALRSFSKYTVDDKRGHTFDLNVCGPVKDSACGEHIGSCQQETTGDKRKWNAGNFNAKLYYEEGLIWANYTGGAKCSNDRYERNTIINFVCAQDNGFGAPVFVDETDGCTYYFSWHTELACEEKVECTAVDDSGKIYDLSPLIKSSGHHLAVTTSEDPSKTDETFYINVCRPLNPIHSTLCPPLSSACKVKAGQKPTSLGKLNARPKYDSSTGKVVLVYDHGEKCASNPSKNYTSRIIFTCVKGPSQGAPQLEELTDDCEYIFSWGTNVVCDEGSAQISTTCQFTDPRTQNTFDLSPLKKSGPYEVDSPSEEMKYYVSPCGAMSTTGNISPDCTRSNSAVCQVNNQNQGTVFGNASKESFIMEGKNLKVGYTDGESCTSSKSGKTAAYILFECANDVVDNGKPEFFSRGPCDVVFKWRTPLACPPVSTECSLSNAGKTYDLHVLSRSTGSWNFNDENGNEYWLNLCQSVHDSPDGSKCPRDAAVCWKKNNKVQMLGTVGSQSISYENGVVVVKYSGGDNGACAVRKRRSNNSAGGVNIYFTCGYSIGKPVVRPKKGDSCTFDIDWISSVACEVRRLTAFDSGGVLTDPETLGTIDLNELNSDYEVRVGTSVYTINLKGQINDASAKCKNSVVCQTAPSENVQSLADVSTKTYYITDDILEATYESNTICDKDSTKKVSTIITFHCTTYEGNPTLTYVSGHCHYLFDWYTKVACVTPDKLLSVAVPFGESDASVSASHSHTAGIVVGVLLSITVLIILLVILVNKDRRSWCAYKARSLFRKSMPFKRMSYSQLSSSIDGENSLLAGGERASLPSFHDDSDEDLIL